MNYREGRELSPKGTKNKNGTRYAKTLNNRLSSWRYLPLGWLSHNYVRFYLSLVTEHRGIRPHFNYTWHLGFSFRMCICVHNDCVSKATVNTYKSLLTRELNTWHCWRLGGLWFTVCKKMGTRSACLPVTQLHIGRMLFAHQIWLFIHPF